jgi:hypothetical protein
MPLITRRLREASSDRALSKYEPTRPIDCRMPSAECWGHETCSWWTPVLNVGGHRICTVREPSGLTSLPVSAWDRRT